MTELRYRQIHLDFHTSEEIPGIGSKFNADEFADTLKAAHVNSITCFARCHHGWIYHYSDKYKAIQHPHLERDLLREQIEACHARDIRVPIYVTVQWDLRTVKEHPEWLTMDANGCHTGTPPFQAGFYTKLCLNTGYVDWLEEYVVDICDTLPTDGFFFDIVDKVDCSCRQCIKGMLDAGLDPSSPADRMDWAGRVLQRFEERLTKVVQSKHPEATIFYNAGHIGPHHRSILPNYTHLELESLPSGGWGYMHFPLTQRFARNLHLDTMGMTGKFHTSWGDFESLKNPLALEFECQNMLALAAKCSIGDQLHPTGQISKATYELVGEAYADVEAVEPWCQGARPVVDIGLMTPEEFAGGSAFSLSGSAMGAVRLLQEGFHQFDVIDSKSDFSKYRLLVLPDGIEVNESLALRLRAYLAQGGALVASYRSGLNPAGTAFDLAELGVRLKGEAPWSPDFIVPGSLGEGLRHTPYVMYQKGLEVEAATSSHILCEMIKPYFNRDWRHFCSHQHTPAEGHASYPGVVQHGNCIYFMHPVFNQYDSNAPLWCKRLVLNAIKRLLPDPLVEAQAPSSALFTLNEQDRRKSSGASRPPLRARTQGQGLRYPGRPTTPVQYQAVD